MNPLPSRHISPKSPVINQLNQHTKLLPTIRKGLLTEPTQTADRHQQRININNPHHHLRLTISYLHLLYQPRVVIKLANIN